MRPQSLFFALGLSLLQTGCTARIDGSRDESAPPPSTAPTQKNEEAPPPSTPRPAKRGPYSSQWEVGEMIASMSAIADGTRIHVIAALITKNLTLDETFLRLDGEDRLTARLGPSGHEVTMSPMPGGTDDVLRYEAFLTPETGAPHVIVAFLRAPGRKNAGLSQVVLAPSFNVTNAPKELVKNAPATVSASGTGFLKIDLVGDCIASPGGRITLGYGQDANVVLDTKLIALTGASTSCDAVLDVRRETVGKVDSAFKRGGFDDILDFEGVQMRSLPVRVSR
jgi:hypothetical protein